MRPGLAAVLASLAYLALAACGGPTAPAGGKAPKTAAERARAEKAASTEDEVSGKGKKWGGWRYAGSDDTCFFIVKRRCFEKREDACAAARCGDRTCVVEGGGPATVRCE